MAPLQILKMGKLFDSIKFNDDSWKNLASLRTNLDPRRHKGGDQINPPPLIFLALHFCSLTGYQKLYGNWYNCFLFVNTSFDPN